jgi:hypothetical protein
VPDIWHIENLITTTVKSVNMKWNDMDPFNLPDTPQSLTQFNEQNHSTETFITNLYSNDFKKYLMDISKNMDGVFLPFIANQTKTKLTTLIKSVLRHFPEAHMVNNLLCLHTDAKKWWTEICFGKTNRGMVYESDSIEQMLKRNPRSDTHQSVFDHDTEWKKKASATRSVSGLGEMIRASSVWIEIDRKIDGGYKKALKDAETFLETFPAHDHVRLWTSGNQSIHIEINGALFGNPTGRADVLAGRGRYIYNLAHDLFGRIRYPDAPLDPWLNKKAAEAYYRDKFGKPKPGFQQEIEEIDPNIYSANSVIRAKWSFHEKTNKPKKLIVGPKRFEPVAPILLATYINACEVRKKQVEIPNLNYDSTLIVEEFFDIEGFDPNNADSESWVRGLHNPFYDDNKPSLSVNIEDGRFWDFGNPDYQFGFVKYLMLKHNWSYDQVKKYIEQNQ